MIVCAILSLTFGMLSGRFAAKASAGYAKNLRKEMFYKIQDYSFENIDKFSTSSLVTRMTTDVTNVQMAFQMIIRILVRGPIMMIFSLLMVASISAKLSVIFLVAIPVLGVILFFIATKAHPNFERVFKKYDKLNNVVQENVSAIRVVKAYVKEGHEKEVTNDQKGNIQVDLSYDENVDETIALIRQELQNRLAELNNENKLIEAQRLEQRVKYDIEMIKEMGYCSGIENYSRIIERRPPGSAPATLLDYFQGDFLTVIDESHVTLPQLKGMYHGDASRKTTLIDYGFRLPCAKDNRPLKNDEFFNKVHQKIYISATPSEFERRTSSLLVEQIIRPTGLIDPKISVRPIGTQIEDLKNEIKKRTEKNERVLITTLTKRMAEDLTDYFIQEGIKVRYLHSEIQSLERVEILRDLRLGEFDVLIGVNLLREGLDIPEVSLVAIMDADKEGFLRSETSLIQTVGRAARNACGEVIMYADRMTESMEKAISETERRRKIQIEYNQKYGIVPQTIKKPIENNLLSLVASYRDLEDIVAEEMVDLGIDKKDLPKLIDKLEKDMHKAAKILDFERAAEIRDKLKKLREMVE